MCCEPVLREHPALAPSALAIERQADLDPVPASVGLARSLVRETAPQVHDLSTADVHDQRGTQLVARREVLGEDVGDGPVPVLCSTVNLREDAVLRSWLGAPSRRGPPQAGSGD